MADYNVPTENQRKYFTDLLQKKVLSPADRDRGLSKANTMTRQQMSVSIAWLEKRGDQPKVVTGEGFYVGSNGEIYSYLYNTKRQCRIWKRFVNLSEDKWKYVAVSGSVARINIETGGHKMDEAEARAFGKAHAYCLMCGAFMHDPVSVDRGIGPECAKKTLWG